MSFKGKILQIKKLQKGALFNIKNKSWRFCIIIIYDSGVIHFWSLLFLTKSDHYIYFITHIILNSHVKWLGYKQNKYSRLS